MNPDECIRLAETYRSGLLGDVLPFWLRHAVDREQGGFYCALDRDGTVIDTDKSMRQHGRFVWLLATLYNTVEHRSEWLEAARHGMDCLFSHGVCEDGRMYFRLARDGAPIRRRRYVFSEAFPCTAAAAFARAVGQTRWADEARRLFHIVWARYTGETTGPAKHEGTRPMRSIGLPMILINVMQVLHDNLGADEGPGTTASTSASRTSSGSWSPG